MPRRSEDREAAAHIAETIGSSVSAERHRLGLTQEELSERVDVSSEALGRIERGTALPSFPTFLRICQALSLKPTELLGGDSSTIAEQETEYSSPDPSRREAKQIARLSEDLDPRSQRVVLGLIRELNRLAAPASQRKKKRRAGPKRGA